jgi:rhodanese-related sulfurtransferase
MHAALHAIGIDADFMPMINPDYLAGPQGSTAAQLVTLAERYGAKGTFRTGMTIATLRAAKSPIILHTSIVASQTGFEHWVVFLGMEGDAIKLYEPPQSVHRFSGAELLSFWDSTGVVVERGGETTALQAVAIQPWMNVEFAFAGIVVLAAGALALRFPILARRPTCALLLVAAASSVVWHATVGYGFFGNHTALENVASSYDKNPLPIIDAEEVRQLVGRPDVTIVDARRPSQFRTAHLPGAINIPITVEQGALRDALDTIPPGNRIVVYCQSKGCEWADAIARKLPAHGFPNVVIFRGGIERWEQIAKEPQRSPEQAAN